MQQLFQGMQQAESMPKTTKIDTTSVETSIRRGMGASEHIFQVKVSFDFHSPLHRAARSSFGGSKVKATPRGGLKAALERWWGSHCSQCFKVDSLRS